MKNGLIHCQITVLLTACLVGTSLPATAQQNGEDRAARIREAAAKPTPHIPDGHPDLTGYWADPPGPGLQYLRSTDGKTVVVVDRDAPELDARAQPRFKERAADKSRRPPYKPQFQPKQRELMYTASRIDPGIHCYPAGVPRIGAPTEIVQTPGAVYFMYAGEGSAESEDMTHTFRVVPIGGKHDPDRDPRPEGDSVAKWEGDTLVIDVVNIDPETWLDGDGDFHDDNLHVTERFTRKGDTLQYDLTIEDPSLFTGPWKPAAGTIAGRAGSRIRIAGSAGQHVIPDYACVERDRDHKVNNDRF
jgi:hypothetical protein